MQPSPPTRSIAERLAAAVGQAPNLRASTATAVVADMVIGALVVTVLAHQPLDRARIDALVDGVLGR